LSRRPEIIKRIPQGTLVLGLRGPGHFLWKLKDQLYSRTPYLMLGKELDGANLSPTPPNGVTLLPASSEDVAQFFQIMAKGDKNSRYELLVRKSFYKQGFHNCYIGRTLDSDEICSIVWQVTFGDIEKTRSENLYPELKHDEMFAENIFTLEKYRGKGVMNSTGRQHEEIARKQGFKRMFFYVREDNIPSLRSSIKRGHFIYQRLLRCHFLFHIKNITIDRIDPPIPISIPHEVQEPESR
jgi:hypothetical protein